MLGLSAGCSEADVAAAYRRAALLYHPDRHPGGSSYAAAQWLKVQSAYERLTSKGGPGTGSAGANRARQSEWQRATQYSGAGRWKEDYRGWEETDMRGNATRGGGPSTRAAGETAGAFVRRRLSQSLAGAAVGGLVLAFLAFDSITRERREPASRPSPDRLTKQAADSFGLPYRAPKLAGRSEAQRQWSANIQHSAHAAAEAAESDAKRAMDAAMKASAAAQRSRLAAGRAAIMDTPGAMAAAAGEAASAADRAARARAAAEYAAACALVAAGPPPREPSLYGVIKGAGASTASQPDASER